MKHRPEETIPEAIEQSPTQPIAVGLALDPERYRSYLESFEMSQAEQDELLQTLWNILSTFVDIGFGLDSVQNLFSGIIENAVREERAGLERVDHFNHIAEPISEKEERNC